MKLTIKIMSLIFLGIIALLAVDGYISVKREINLFDNDMKQNAHLLGNTVKELTLGTWHEAGLVSALKILTMKWTKNRCLNIVFVLTPNM